MIYQSEHIEIRRDGDVRASGVTIGQIAFSIPYPAEYQGDWFLSDPKEDWAEERAELEAEVGAIADELDEVRTQLGEAEDDRDEAQSTLKSMMDEVRVFLARDEADRADPAAIQRLRDALEAAQ